ncbi:MAG TPA: oxygenase MpaB family protein [Cellulomonas sp.]
MPRPTALPTPGGLRAALGSALFVRVAGPRGDAVRERIHGTPGPRWFAEGSAIRRVHGDASMFVGGLRALLLQSLHPLAMAAVAEHSGYRSDPWGRLQRTSTFLAATTFGTAEQAEQLVGTVRRVHERVHGVTSDGVPYAASDPHLVRWVHVAEVDSFLAAHQRYGARPLDAAGCDEYVAQAARVARALGAQDPPESVADLRAQLAAYAPELRATTEARDAARFLLVRPPVPVLALPGYAALAAAAVAELPRSARRPLGLLDLPLLDATLARAGGHGVTRLVRWALASQPQPQPPVPGPAGGGPEQPARPSRPDDVVGSRDTRG